MDGVLARTPGKVKPGLAGQGYRLCSNLRTSGMRGGPVFQAPGQAGRKKSRAISCHVSLHHPADFLDRSVDLLRVQRGA
jgi:hypothetical protein